MIFTPPKILIAPDKFKGTLSATEAAEAIMRGLRQVNSDYELRQHPIADGGEGTVDAIRAAMGGELLEIPCVDPTGALRDAEALVVDIDSAVFEMSAASGLKLVSPDMRNPWGLSTRGVGMVIRTLIDAGCQNINVGLGGSATNDMGAGMAVPLGFRFLDKNGATLSPVPNNFLKVDKVLAPNIPLEKSVEGVSITGLCDVTNPLLGPDGASFVYGPQKGLKNPAEMDDALAHLVDVIKRDLGLDYSREPGAGAAGGLGYGLMTFCGAKLKPGFATLCELTNLEELINMSDVIITGEGKIDRQTLFGKGPAELARLAHDKGKLVLGVGGKVDEDARGGLKEVFAEVYELSGPDSAGAGAAAALEAAAVRMAKDLPRFLNRE